MFENSHVLVTYDNLFPLIETAVLLQTQSGRNNIRSRKLYQVGIVFLDATLFLYSPFSLFPWVQVFKFRLSSFPRGQFYYIFICKNILQRGWLLRVDLPRIIIQTKYDKK